MTLFDPSAADLEGSTPPSDAELILAVRAGDRNAYGVLYERHLAAARTQARRLTRSSADADVLVSAAFAKVAGAGSGGSMTSPALGWAPRHAGTAMQTAEGMTLPCEIGAAT